MRFALLGAVHRNVGIFDQGFGIIAIVGIDADADARGNLQLVSLHHDGQGQVSRIFCATMAASSCFVIFTKAATNSSPPMREMISALRRLAVSRLATSLSRISPCA